MNEELYGLLGLDPEKIRQQQQMQGLLSAGLNILAASGPSTTPRSLGQIVAQGGMAGLQAYEQAGEQAIQGGVQKLKIGELKDAMAERKRIRELGGRLAEPQKAMVPSTDAEAQEGGFYGQPGVNVLPTRMGINQNVARQLMATPGGMEYLKNYVTTQREIAGKTELVEIYGPSGQPMKVRYNIDTNEFTPVGGEKAEPFVQIDRGNVIELRTPSNKLIGVLPKGVAPTAPSFTMTDYGAFNTKTGQITPPTDAQGNPITVDLTTKSSEDEKKSAGFYLRMKDATNTFNSPVTDAQGKPVLKDGKPVLLKDAAEKPELFAEVIGGIIPNWMGGQAAQNFATSALRQRYQQAQENWVTANLRPESGAVIGPEEMAKEIRKYFPQVGDAPETVRQKEESRKVTEDAVRRRAGRALATQQQQRNVTVNY